MESFWMRAVDSRKSVSLGGSLWKTTLEMEDFPDLLWPISNRRGLPLADRPAAAAAAATAAGSPGFCPSFLGFAPPDPVCS